MKLGDLVRVKGSSGCDLFTESYVNNVLAKDVHVGIVFALDEIGVVLGEKERPLTNVQTHHFTKVLTPNGIGWVRTYRLEEVT